MHSAILSDKLEELGCTARKSLTLCFPQWLTDATLRRHFIRGYFDGDGSIGSCKRKDRACLDYWFSITSTNTFCEAISAIMISGIGFPGLLKRTHPKSKTNTITTTLYLRGSKKICRFLDWLYADATIFLPRKHQKYVELKQHVANLTAK
jgi:DNA-binding transcriptional regulator WhiA